MKTVKIKGKDYVMVSERLRYLSEAEEIQYSIKTEPTFFEDQGAWMVKAVLMIEGKGTFTGHAYEVIGDGMINKTSALENCETSAVGRACAMAGIGIIDGIASASEMQKVERMEKLSQAQASTIESLMETTSLSDEVVESIENTYLSYSIEKAKKCIQYLKNNQVRPLDRGNMSMTEINEAVADKLADERA